MAGGENQKADEESWNRLNVYLQHGGSIRQCRACGTLQREDVPEKREVLVRARVVRVDGLVRHLLQLVCGEVRRVRDRT